MLSGKRSISPATRRRVERSIRTLGYRPHAGARALASRRTSVLALVTPLRADLHTPVTMEFVISVVTAARRHAHDVLLLTIDEGPEGIRRVAGTALVDGLVLMDVQLRDERIPVLRELGLPAVLIGVPDDTSGLTCIDLDFRSAGARCVDHLADLGHRVIAFVGHGEPTCTGADRASRRARWRASSRARRELRALRASRHARGTSARSSPACSRAIRPSPASSSTTRRRSRWCSTRCAPAGGACPRTSRSSPSRPPTSPSGPRRRPAVDLPAEEMGERAVELLMAKLAARPEHSMTLLAPRLVARASSAAAPVPV